MDRTPISKRHTAFVTPKRAKAVLGDKSNIFGTPLSTNKLNSSKKNLKHTVCIESEINKICVSVRVRPPPSKDLNDYCISKFSETEIRVKQSATKDLGIENHLLFSYDHIFWFNESDQDDIFKKLAIPLLNSSLEGYNACLFAYGQTGSGKTYSLMDSDGNFTHEGMGIIPRFCNELINRKTCNESSKLSINVSYFEIYNEKIYDLLKEDPGSLENRSNLKVREHPLNGPYVADLMVLPINTFEEAMILVKKGNCRRVTGSTLHNERSSRSHTIFDISLSVTPGGQSKVRLVDLAGSERVTQCTITEERFKEGLSINKSLLTLGKVITALAEKKKRIYVPYRESALTWLLRDSLGGNAKTCMLATISPSPAALEETLSTLRWANKARSIVCNVTKNEDPQIRLIVELQNEVKRLKNLREDMSTTNDSNSWTELEELQNKIDLEQQQKSVEKQLQTALATLEVNLDLAEKEKCELESQRNIILQEASENSIPSFKSNFYDSLKNILNCSLNDSVIDVESSPRAVTSTLQLKSKYLHKMQRLSECLKSLYQTEITINSDSPDSESNVAFQLMSEIEERLHRVINLNN